ncbi:MAG: hypothetical protein WBD67_10025, partial [Terracidiphilus sp.]
VQRGPEGLNGARRDLFDFTGRAGVGRGEGSVQFLVRRLSIKWFRNLALQMLHFGRPLCRSEGARHNENDTKKYHKRGQSLFRFGNANPADMAILNEPGELRTVQNLDSDNTVD